RAGPSCRCRTVTSVPLVAFSCKSRTGACRRGARSVECDASAQEKGPGQQPGPCACRAVRAASVGDAEFADGEVSEAVRCPDRHILDAAAESEASGAGVTVSDIDC